jgi:hypothetical protein
VVHSASAMSAGHCAESALRKPIGKRHSQAFVLGVRLERFDASVSVPLSGLTVNDR